MTPPIAPGAALRWSSTLTRSIEESLDPEKLLRTAYMGTVTRLATNIVKLTPVKTGLAKGNWRINFEGVAGSRPFNTKDPDGYSTIQRIIETASRFAARSSFILYNNVPYIEKLEAGSSRQAPAGMVALSLAQFQAEESSITGELYDQIQAKIEQIAGPGTVKRSK